VNDSTYKDEVTRAREGNLAAILLDHLAGYECKYGRERDFVLSREENVLTVEAGPAKFTVTVALHVEAYTPGERVAHTLSDMIGTIVERPTDRPDWHPNPEHPIVHWDGNSPHHFAAVPPSHLVKLEML
jgi:hypothetical protein